MICNVTTMCESLLEQARNQFLQASNAESKLISDPVITPFAIAMKLIGFRAVLIQECTVLRGCPHCKSWYSTKYTRDAATYWGCPHCRRIDLENGSIHEDRPV